MAKFRRLWFGHGAKSDSGVSVKFKGLHDIEYRDGGRTLIAFRERLTGDPAMDIDSTSIAAWEPPFANEPLTDTKKQEILDNICRAADRLGISYVIR
jgi:hypothetical protein